MRKFIVFVGALLFSFYSVSVHALEVEYGTLGYVRFGYGVSSGGETKVCFKAPGAGAKYRLGNECEVWAEFDGHVTFRGEDKNSPFLRVEGMASFYGPNEKSVEYQRMEGALVELGNFSSLMPGAKIWAGRRYYDRHDVHLNDYFFSSMSGEGGGIRDWDWGFAKFAYAFTRSNVLPEGDITFTKTPVQYSHDFRLYDLPANENGKLFLFFNYSHSLNHDFTAADGSEKTLEKAKGYAFNIMHTQEKFFGGFNKLVLQYGSGMSRNAGSAVSVGLSSFDQLSDPDQASDLEGSVTWRVIDQTVIEFHDWALMSNMLYERKDFSDFDGVDQSWMSFALRPMWFITDNTRVLSELSHDQVDNKAKDVNGALQKLTMALEYAKQRGVWERPVIRLYGTYAWWPKSWLGQVGGETYGKDTKGWNVGVQFEHWW